LECAGKLLQSIKIEFLQILNFAQREKANDLACLLSPILLQLNYTCQARACEFQVSFPKSAPNPDRPSEMHDALSPLLSRGHHLPDNPLFVIRRFESATIVNQAQLWPASLIVAEFGIEYNAGNPLENQKWSESSQPKNKSVS